MDCEVELTVKQKNAIKKLRLAIKAMKESNLICFLGDTGCLYVYKGSVPMNGFGGRLNQDEAVDVIDTGGWDGGGE